MKSRFGMKSRCALGATAMLLLPPRVLPNIEMPRTAPGHGGAQPRRGRPRDRGLGARAAARAEGRDRPQRDAGQRAERYPLPLRRPRAGRSGAAGLRPRAALRRPSLRRDLRPGRPGGRLHLRHRRAAHAARDAPRRRLPGGGRHPRVRRAAQPGAGPHHLQPLRRGVRRRRGRPARGGPGGDLRLGRGLQHRAAQRRLVPGRGREAVPGRPLRPLRPRALGGAGPRTARGDRAVVRQPERRRLLHARRHPVAQGLPALAPEVQPRQLGLHPRPVPPHPQEDAAAPRGGLRGPGGHAGARVRRRRGHAARAGTAGTARR